MTKSGEATAGHTDATNVKPCGPCTPPSRTCRFNEEWVSEAGHKGFSGIAMTTRGSLDIVQPGLIAGWVMRPDKPSEPLRIRIRIDHALVAEIVADTYRADLAAVGIGDGRCGFALHGASAALPPVACLVTVEDQASGHVVLSRHATPTVVATPESIPSTPSDPAPAPTKGLAPGADRASVQGHIDIITSQRLAGWVWRPDQPLETVRIRVSADGRVITRAVANSHRPDLERAGVGTGRYGFDLISDFNPPAGPCLITVEDDATGVALTGSPARLEAPLKLDGPAAKAITALFDSPGSDDELRARAEFAALQADRLIQRISDVRSRPIERAAQRARKWRWRPEDGPEPPHVPPRALVIDSTMPLHGRDAGSHAILSHMASLRRLGFDILFVPADMRNGPGATTLDSMGIACATEPWSASVEEVMRREGVGFELVYIHRHDPAARYVALAQHYMPRARRIYAVADLHGLRLKRQGEIEDRPDLVAHAKFVHQAEVASAAGCHAVITHSPVEAGILRRSLPHDRVEVVPWHVPVDVTSPTFDQRQGIAFVGSFSHAPNLDAALWLRDEVLPLVWEADPGIICTLAGTGMPQILTEPHDPRFRPAGWVETLSDLLGQIRLTVAPLAYGAGLKGKVADSLAMGVPCVCSPIAAEGFDLPPPLRDLVAADAAGLAASIVRLHRDPVLFATCREAGLAYVAHAFSEAVVDAGLRRAAGMPEMPGVLRADGLA